MEKSPLANPANGAPSNQKLPSPSSGPPPYNYTRLHSAIGYVTPSDMLAGRQAAIHAERDRKLEAARQQRQSHGQQGTTA